MPKRKAGTPKHEAGSLRAEGITSVAIDKPTRAKLKELAGDMAVSRYLRLLVHGQIQLPHVSAQAALRGQESTVSPATIHSVAAGISELRANTATREDYNTLELLICDIARAVGVKTINTGIRAKVKSLARSITPESSQVELNLGK